MKKRILIIDDEPDIGELLTTFFKAKGYEVGVACDGASGLAEMERRPPHVLLLDYILPNMDGIEILCEARHRWPGLPVVMITGYNSPELNIRANKFSVIAVISKPFDTNHLLDVIERITK